MWTKRREEDSFTQTLPEPAPPPPPVARPLAVGGTAAAAVLAREPEPKAPRRGASLGPSIVIRGEIYSAEELFIDGQLDGKLELEHRLTVGKNGKVKASIKAKEVVVYGSIHGDIEAVDKIVIHKEGSVVGDVQTAGIVIEDGAYFKGGIDIIRPVVAATPPPTS